MAHVYVSCHDKELARNIAAALRDRGHKVVSTWHDEDPINGGEGPDYANRNADQIRRAGVLILVGGPDKYPGGKFVEAGIAHANHVSVYVLGRIENGMVFGIADRVFDDLDGLLKGL